MRQQVLILVVLATLCGVPDAHAGVLFTPLGYLPGGSRESWARGVSADGAVVVGESRNRDGTFEGFRWTRATGMVGLGVAPGGWASTAYDVSADGSVVVGGVGADPSRWTQSTGKVILPSLTGRGGLANVVSADGSVAAGYVIKEVRGYPKSFVGVFWGLMRRLGNGTRVGCQATVSEASGGCC